MRWHHVNIYDTHSGYVSLQRDWVVMPGMMGVVPITIWVLYGALVKNPWAFFSSCGRTNTFYGGITYYTQTLHSVAWVALRLTLRQGRDLVDHDTLLSAWSISLYSDHFEWRVRDDVELRR